MDHLVASFSIISYFEIDNGTNEMVFGTKLMHPYSHIFNTRAEKSGLVIDYF